MCEPILNRYASDDFTVTTFRPATVCGYSPRMRFDLSVNILVNHALTLGEITVFGGSQLRPNLHISDYSDAVILLMNAPKEKIQNQIFNVGGENLSILEIAKLVKEIVEDQRAVEQEIKISIEDTNDPRSYHINSEKIKRELGFVPRKNVRFAVLELIEAFKNGAFGDTMKDDQYHNVRTLKKMSIT
jgi:nucleoside-diphosphate-sugar epimerase